MGARTKLETVSVGQVKAGNRIFVYLDVHTVLEIQHFATESVITVSPVNSDKIFSFAVECGATVQRLVD